MRPSKTSRGPVSAAGSDPGRERENNEDRTLCEPALGIYAVVDGVGGESGGEVAAEIAVEVLRARLSRRTTEPARLLREAIALANRQILEKAQAEPDLAGMACVLTVAVLDGDTATIGHVGDSRLYQLRRGEIRKITKDHSPVGIREDAGELSESEAMAHPRRNEIFRDVGSAPHEPEEKGFVDITTLTFDAESALLLCSDGLSDLVPAAALREIVEAYAGRPDEAVRALIDAANRAGGKDNISVVLVAGERYGQGISRPAADDPLESTHVTPRTPHRPPLRGAAQASPTAGEMAGRALRRGLLLGLLLLVAGGGWLFRERIVELLARFGLGKPAPLPTLHVDPQGMGTEGFRTLAAALEAAQPGQTIEAAPGLYEGPIELKSGVSLISKTPRGAILRLPQGTAEPAITAEGVDNVRLAGFKIEGTADAPLEIGLRLADSAIVAEDLEISGAATAGIEISGADRSEIHASYVHDNPGTGAIVRDQASPRLEQNVFLRNGAGPEEKRPGIEIRDAARPQLLQNQIKENAAAGVWVPTADRVDEVFTFNTFDQPKDKAVPTPPPPPPAAAPAPLR